MTNTISVSKALYIFAAVSIILFLFFALIRLPYMNSDHFIFADGREITEEDSGPWLSFYLSAMFQSTVGDSTMVPKSTSAQVINAVQAMSTLLGIVVLALIVASTYEVPASPKTLET